MKKIIIAAVATVLTLAFTLGIMTYNTTTNLLLSANINALTNSEDSGAGGGNNEEGGSTFYYEKLMGRPEICYSYRYMNENGNIFYSEEQISGSSEGAVVRIEGIIMTCPHQGNGCTPTACSATY